MNYNLLKELMKQSETECGFNTDKFAELIVKECLVVINQSNGVGDDDVIRISKDVEKHFGVEE